MHANEEHVQAGQQGGELDPPGPELDDVLDDQVVSRRGKRRQATMESGEEPRPDLVPPVERTAVAGALGQHAHQLI